MGIQKGAGFIGEDGHPHRGAEVEPIPQAPEIRATNKARNGARRWKRGKGMEERPKVQGPFRSAGRVA